MITLTKTPNKRLLQPLFSGIAIALVSMTAFATQLNLSDTPLFLTASIPPNLVLTLDDSLSMPWAAVPDSIADTTHAATLRFKSAYYNTLYYNPSVIYTPPPKYNGTSCTLTSSSSTCYPNVSFTAAPLNGFAPSRGTVNLSTSYRATYTYSPDDTAQVNAGSLSARLAYYYLFYTQAGVSRPSACTATASGQKDDDDCYINVNISTSERQNFANWYSYYRTRNLATVSSTMRAFANIDETTRVAWQGLSTCTTFETDCDGWTVSGDTIGLNKDNRIRRLNATLSNGKTHKQELFEWLSRFPTAGSTYTLKAAERAGQYFQGTISISHPFADDPQIREFPLNPDGTSRTTYDACRRNVHVLMTDGGWCGGSDSSKRVSVGDTNSTAITVPLGPSDGAAIDPKNTPNYSWTPIAPYRDGQANNLSDLAFKYWATDLQSALDNNLLPIIKDLSGSTTVDNNNITEAQWLNPRNDPATWQHLNTYAVGLGLQSTLVSPYAAWGGSTFAGDYSKLAAGTSCPTSTTGSSTASAFCWPYTNTTDSCPPSDLDQQRKTYDLWHAAISSRGKFFSSESPDQLVSAFDSILSEVSGNNASATAAAANSTNIQTGTVLFQAQFDPRNWGGHLYNLTVSSDGTIKDLNSDGKLDGSDANWDSATLIPASTSRNIRTFNGTAAVEFVWGNLSGAQQTALQTGSAGLGTVTMGQDRLNWLRGDTTNEVRNGGIFRNRIATVLGDIINSDPVFSHIENYGYSSLPTTATERTTYAAFVSGKNTRSPILYNGANDGMLHAFRADTGNANSGKELFAYIPAAVYGNLSSLTETDYSHKYFVDGSNNISDAYLSAWKTVLVGGLGKGGKAIYALDISNPDSFTNANVLWEYSGAASDTGSTGTLDNAGMGLTYGQPQIARMNNGSWVAIFSNGYNSTSERAFLYIVNLSDGTLIKKIPTNTATSNGLSTPRLYDSDNDKIIDFVYAGDLQGNMWKFDLSGTTSASWGLGNGGNPLFTARNSSNQIQAITAQPTIGAHSSGGVLVYFGTGSYLTNTDVSDITVQSFYAIWDKPSATTTVARSSLVQQTIIEEVAKGTTKTLSGCTDDPATTVNECLVTFNYDLRATSSNTVDYTSKFGWYLDLLPVSGVVAGERIDSAALLKNSRVIFLTRIPSADPCISGGSSWLMEMDASTGGATSTSSFDFNKDGKFDDKDKLSSNNTASGIKSTVGMVKALVWLDKEGTSTTSSSSTSSNSSTSYIEMSGSTTMVSTVEQENTTTCSTPPCGSGGGNVNRTYWLQIQ